MSVLSALAKAAAKAAQKAGKSAKNAATLAPAKSPSQAKVRRRVAGTALAAGAGAVALSQGGKEKSREERQADFDKALKEKKKTWESEGYSAEEQIKMTKELHSKFFRK